jgi:hypothetical protein
MVILLDAINKTSIEFKKPISTEKRIYYKIDHKPANVPKIEGDVVDQYMKMPLNSNRNEKEILNHLGGGKTNIYYKDKESKRTELSSLWNFTANSLASKMEDFEGVAKMLDYLIKEYPEIYNNLEAHLDANKFGI